MISNFSLHLKHASRSLARSPGFSAPAVLLLALGIGVNTAVFTVMNRTIPIVGVMPETFRLLLGHATNVSPHIDLWRPMGRNTDVFTGRLLRSICHLADGVSLAQAQSQMDAIAKRLADIYPDIYDTTGVTIRLVPLHEDYVREIRPAILTLAGSAGLILVIACTNVAGLSLVRTRAREKEMAVRAALGAGMWRIVLQTLTETVLLSVVAGGVGVVLASWGVKTLIHLHPDTLPRTPDISVDGTVFFFVVAIASMTCFAIGSVAAAHACRLDLHKGLKRGARWSSGRVRSRFRYALIAGEVALSLILLVGAGLLIRTFSNLLQVDLGSWPDAASRSRTIEEPAGSS